MLKKAESNDTLSILNFCKNSIIGTKISCLCLCYGFERDFFEVWTQTQNEKITVVITKFYDDLTVYCDEKCDFEALNVFLSMLSYNTLNCNSLLCEKLEFENFTVKNGYEFSGKAEFYNFAKKMTEDKYKKAYDLISNEIPNSFHKDKQAYLSFLSDFTFRSIRDRARGFYIEEDGEIVATVITAAESDSAAVLSGVACSKNVRGKGYGKKIVLSAASFFENIGKKVYVIALNESAEAFYEHIGFVKKEKIIYIER